MYIDCIEDQSVKFPLIAVVHSEGEHFDTTLDGVVAIANEFSDFIEFLNEGAPIYLGNSYAWYELKVLVDGYQYTFGVDADDVARLNRGGEAKLYACPWSDLEEE